MCCGRVGIYWIPIDVVSGYYSSVGIRAPAKKMLFKLADKSYARESHSLTPGKVTLSLTPNPSVLKLGSSGVSETSGGQHAERQQKRGVEEEQVGPENSRLAEGDWIQPQSLPWTCLVSWSLYILCLSLPVC